VLEVTKKNVHRYLEIKQEEKRRIYGRMEIKVTVVHKGINIKGIMIQKRRNEGRINANMEPNERKYMTK